MQLSVVRVVRRHQFILLTRIFHELLSRDREDGGATGQSRAIAGKDGHIRGGSKSFMKYPG